jgi:threonine/homoserine/homoserine lactone efflux protein
VATDIEATVPQALDAAVAEKPSSVEHVARANMVKAVAVSVPLAVVVFLGLVSLAVRNQDPDWPAYLSMAAGIGVLAGVFFGLLAGFMRSIHLSDN